MTRKKAPAKKIPVATRPTSRTRRQSREQTVVVPIRRHRNRAEKEIRRLQRSTKLLLRKLPFSRVVREIGNKLMLNEDLKFTASSIEALQCATEAFLVQLFEDANRLAYHAKRVTVMPADFQVLKELRNLH